MKSKILLAAVSFVLSSAFFSLGQGSGYANEIKLNKTSFQLHINESAPLRIKGLSKGMKAVFSSENPHIVSISKKGRLTGKAFGEAALTIKILDKKGRVHSKKRVSASVTNTFLASSGKDLELASKNLTKDAVLLRPKKESRFVLKSGKHNYSLMIDMGASKKKVSLILNDNVFLKNLTLVKGKKADIKIMGEVAQLVLGADSMHSSLSTEGKKARVSSIVVEQSSRLSLTTEAKTKDENGLKLYVSKPSSIFIKGKSKTPLTVFLQKEAEESTVTTERSISYISDLPATLVLLAGSEKSEITTLNYKTSVTVDNRTKKTVSVNTPSLTKTVEAGQRKTVSGKK